MNGDIVWMAIAVASLAVIALAGMGIVIASLTYSYQRAKLGKPDPAPVEPDAATQAELAALRKRVATLERLVTDDDRRIAREIDGLRPSETSLHP